MNLDQTFFSQASQFCKHVPVQSFDYSVNISLKHRYLFVETPKVACSSIKTTLQRLELDDQTFVRSNFEDIHNRGFSPLLKPSQVGDLIKFMERKDIFKFCFVRNPYTRLLSAWKDKIHGNRPPKSQVLLQIGKDPSKLNQEVSFAEFVAAVVEQPISMMDPHWRTQYFQTFQAGIKYDAIGHFESFENDFDHVLNAIHSEHTAGAPYVQRERRNATSANDSVFDFYTPATIAMVKTKFAIDFEYFGYKPDLQRNNAD